MRLTETQLRTLIRSLLTEAKTLADVAKTLTAKGFLKILTAYAYSTGEDHADSLERVKSVKEEWNQARTPPYGDKLHPHLDIDATGRRLLNMVPADIPEDKKGLALEFIKRDFSDAVNTNRQDFFLSDGVTIKDYDLALSKGIELYFQRIDHVKQNNITAIKNSKELFNNVENAREAYARSQAATLEKEKKKEKMDPVLGVKFWAGSATEVEQGGKIKFISQMQDIPNTTHDDEIKFPVLEFNEEGWVITVHENHGAACTMGKGTDWCTAAPGLDYFDQYNKHDDPLFFFMNEEGERYQFSYGSDQYMDIYDMDVSDELRGELTSMLLRVGGERLEEEYPKVVINIKMQSKDTPPEDLIKYGRQALADKDLNLQYRILINDNATREVRDLMVDSTSFKVVNYLAQADVSPETLIKLATMATSPFEGSDYDMYNPDLIKNLIQNKELPTEAVDMIAGYRKASTGVAQLAAEHPNISVEALERMLQALKDIGVKSAPSLNAIALNRKATPEMLLSIVDLDLNDFELVRYLVANPNIPQEAHVKLFNKWKNIPGITSIIEAPGLPVDLLKKFIEEKPDKALYLVNSPESEFLEHLFYINNREDSPIPEEERRAINMELATNRYLPQSLIRQMLEKETDRQDFPQQVHDNLIANSATALSDLEDTNIWNPDNLDNLDTWRKQFFARRSEAEVINVLQAESISDIDSETQRYTGEYQQLREVLAENRSASWEMLSKMIYDPRQGETVRMIAIDNVLKGSLPDIHKQYLIASLGIKPYKPSTGEETYRFNRWPKQNIKDEDSHEAGWWRMSFTPDGERSNKVTSDFNRIQRLTTQKLNQMRTTGRYHDQIGGLYSPLQRREAGLPPLEKQQINENIASRWQKLAGIL